MLKRLRMRLRTKEISEKIFSIPAPDAAMVALAREFRVENGDIGD